MITLSHGAGGRLSHQLGQEAAIIGTVRQGPPLVTLVTSLGTTRVVRMPEGELLPRIC